MNRMKMIVAGVCAAVLASCGLFGQTATTPPAFEVASIKPAAPGERGGISGGPGTSDPGLFRWSLVTLRGLILRAYELKGFQLLGPSVLSNSIGANRYSIVAKVPPGATKDQFNQMLQGLLVERFGLVFHHETKDVAYYELVVAKAGLKMKEAEAAPETPAAKGDSAGPAGAARTNVTTGDPRLSGVAPGHRAMLVGGLSGGGHRMMARMQSAADLAGFLSTQSARPVMDGTGLTGLYDFVLDYVPEGGLAATLGGPAIPEAQPGQGAAPQESAPGAPPSLSVAIEQQLGLKFEPRKGPFDVFVVDHVERVPKEN
jgi:uncharacterized protein (TIGR03435 family)